MSPTSNGTVRRFTAFFSGDMKAYTTDTDSSGLGLSNGQVNYRFARDRGDSLESTFYKTHNLDRSPGYMSLQSRKA